MTRSHTRMCFEPARNALSVVTMRPHAQMKRLQPAQRKKRVERSRDRRRVLQKRQPVGKFFVFSHNYNAADHVGMPVQVLRRRVHRHIETELKRPLHERRRKRIVGRGDRSNRAPDLRDCRKIDSFSIGLDGVSTQMMRGT